MEVIERTTRRDPISDIPRPDIPLGWRSLKLGEIAQFRTGPFGSSLHKSDYVKGGIPVVNPMHIIDGRIRATDSMAVSRQAADRLSDFRLVAGDVVIGRRGDMGRCATVGINEHGWICGTGSMIVRTDEAVDSRYIQRVLSSEAIVLALNNAAIGSTMSNLNQGILAELEIQIPKSKKEQSAIADALDDADAYIESLERLLAKKRTIMQGAMQELLTGKRRLPGFRKPWALETLRDLGAWKGGMTPSMSNPRYWENGTVPWVSSGDVKVTNLATTAQSITPLAIAEHKTTLVPAGSILIVTRSGILRKYLPVAVADTEMAINQDIKALLPSKKHVPKFIQLSITFHGPQILASCLKSGTTVESIEYNWLKKFSIQTPDTDEQNAIAKVLLDMELEIRSLESNLMKAREIKQGMMQQLLTGKVRLV